MSARSELFRMVLCLTSVVLTFGGDLTAAGADASSQAGSFVGPRWAVATFELAGEDSWVTPAFERGEPVRGILHFAEPIRAEGAWVTVRVSDSFGRLLVDKKLAVPPSDEPVTQMPLEIDVPAVLGQRHTVNLVIQQADRTTQATSRDLLYRPPATWDDYICTIWHRHNAKRIPYLQNMYLSGTQWSGNSSHLPQHFIDRNYRYYVESGADWIFAAYHIWMPDKPKTYYFKQAREAFKKDRTDLRVLERNPCLADHVVQDQIRWKFTHEARMHRDTRPLFYTVADEPGIGNQAAPFDFCFAPQSREAFRQWLKQRYADLAELNAQWGSSFADWNEVRGATTDEIFARQDDNFSAWCDFKDFMDSQLIDNYALAKQYMSKHDPDGRIGMGGAQGPAAVGGWDFWKLCEVFDVLEAYYIGNNYELMRSFNPDLIPFHCSFGKDNPEKHLIWYLFIHGDRGLLVWDDNSQYVDDAGQYSERAKQAKPIYEELTGGIGKLRIASRRVDDPIALYHSQANLRVHWVLEVRPAGEKWVERNSWHERTDSRYFRLRESWVKLIEDNGLQYRFLCPAQVVAGELKPYDPATGEGFKVLILPEILAMSASEVGAIRRFVEAGGAVLADRRLAEFDEHGKRVEAGRLADLFDDESGRAIMLDRDMIVYYHQRLYPQQEEELKSLVGNHLRRLLGNDRVTPQVVDASSQPVTGVETTVWHNGEVDLIALHRNPQLRINELGPQEYKSNEKFETPVTLTLTRADEASWYDLRANRPAGQGTEISVVLQPFEPVILAAFGQQPKSPTVAVKGNRITIEPAQPCSMDSPTYHLAFVGPDGNERLVYRSNFTCGPQGGSLELPLALNDAPGRWTLRVRDVATGREQEVAFDFDGKAMAR